MIKDSSFSHHDSVLNKNVDLSASVLPDGRWLLYNQTENTFAVLNASAGVFWEFCDGKATLAEIAAELHGLYPEMDVAALHEEIERVIPLLLEQGLIVHGN